MSALLIACTALLAGEVTPALAALTCGPEPELPADAAARIKTDVDAKTNAILQASGGRDARNLVIRQRHALREAYPEVEAPTLDGYLLWETCQTISHDPALLATQQFDKYSDFYRLLSEPIKAPPHSE